MLTLRRTPASNECCLIFYVKYDKVPEMPKPYPDKRMIKKVKKLQRKKLSLAAISRVLQKDYKSVWRWAHY